MALLPLIRKLKRLIDLPACERITLAEAVILLALVRLGLHTKGFKTTRSILENHYLNPKRFRPLQQPNSDMPRLAQLVEIAARQQGLAATCLERSLVLWALLKRRGIMCQLQIGARRENDSFAAHAWVEYNGAVLNDRRQVVEQYAVLDGVEQMLGRA